MVGAKSRRYTCSRALRPSSRDTRKRLISAFDLLTAEKVTENLAGMTSQVAPCDVSSVYGIRRAMGIAVPLDTESFADLTTGEHPSTHLCLCDAQQTSDPVGCLLQCRRWQN